MDASSSEGAPGDRSGTPEISETPQPLGAPRGIPAELIRAHLAQRLLATDPTLRSELPRELREATTARLLAAQSAALESAARGELWAQAGGRAVVRELLCRELNLAAPSPGYAWSGERLRRREEPSPRAVLVARLVSSEAPASSAAAATQTERTEAPVTAGEERPEERFLDTSNIRWGLVVGAMLLIAGSIPLAMALWRQDDAILKLSVFVGASLGLLGLGELCVRKLGLALTGRALIAAFLFTAPLNLLAADALAVTSVASLPLGLLLLLAIWQAGRRLGLDPPSVCFGVSALSLLQLAPGLSVASGAPIGERLLVAGGLVFFASVMLGVRRAPRWQAAELGLGALALNAAALLFAHLALALRLSSTGATDPWSLSAWLALTGFALMTAGSSASLRARPEARARVVELLLGLCSDLLIVAALLVAREAAELALLIALVSTAINARCYGRWARARDLASLVVTGSFAASAAIALLNVRAGLFTSMDGLREHAPVVLGYGVLASSLVLWGKRTHARGVFALSVLGASLLLLLTGLEAAGLLVGLALVYGATLTVRDEGLLAHGFTWLGAAGGGLICARELGPGLSSFALGLAASSLLSALIIAPSPLRSWRPQASSALGLSAPALAAGALALGVWQGPISFLRATALMAAASLGSSLWRVPQAWNAGWFTLALTLAIATVTGAPERIEVAVSQPGVGLRLAIGGALAALLAALILRLRPASKEGFARPSAAVAAVLATLAGGWELALELHASSLNEGPFGLASGGALLAAALASLVSAVISRRRLPSCIAAAQLLVGSSLLWHGPGRFQDPWTPVCLVLQALLIAEIPALIRRLGGSEWWSLQRDAWRWVCIAAVIPNSVALLGGFKDVSSYSPDALTLSAVGLALFYARRHRPGDTLGCQHAFSVHVYLAIYRLVLGLELNDNEQLAALAAVLPVACLTLRQLASTARLRDVELAESLGLTSDWLARGLLCGSGLLLLSLLGSDRATMLTGVRLGSCALAAHFALGVWRYDLRAGPPLLGALTLATAWLIEGWIPASLVALSFGAGVTGCVPRALFRAPLLEASPRRSAQLRALEPWLAALLTCGAACALLPFERGAPLSASALYPPASAFATLSLALIALAGLCSRWDRLFTLGLATASLACQHAVALGAPGRSLAWQQELIGHGGVGLGLAILCALLTRLGPTPPRDDLDRARLFGFASLANAAIGSAVLVTLSAFASLRVTAPLSDGGFLSGVLLGIGLTLFWCHHARSRRTELSVYLAESSVFSLLVFLRICRPELFASPIVATLWPPLMTGVALLAVLASTKLQGGVRRAAARTGLALPLVPIAFTLASSSFGSSGVVLLLTAGVYAVVGRQRGSARCSLLAGWLACASLLCGLLWGQLSFDAYPYLFGVPLSAGLLVTSRSLQPDQARVAALLRDIALGALMALLTWSLIEDAQRSVLESLLLALVAIGGLLIGIRIRERSLMILSTAFVVLDIGTNIYRIGEQHAWIWWLSLMLLGLAVIALFSYFERLRGSLATEPGAADGGQAEATDTLEPGQAGATDALEGGEAGPRGED